jgi:hypothetical protein
MTRYYAWIGYSGQHGGDTYVDAQDATQALAVAVEWGKAGVYQPGDIVHVMVTRDRDPMPSTPLVEAEATFVVA